MYDDLVRELQCCPDGEYGCSRCDYKNSIHCRETLMKQAADAIEELSRDLNSAGQTIADLTIEKAVRGETRWIPVAERLPEEYVSVLCYCSRNGQYGCGERCKEDNGTIYWIGLNGMIPSHWMPLPQPPKEETE